MSRRQASTLATVLLVLGVAMVLIFTMAQAAVFHLRFATGVDNRQHARNLAESAVAVALAKLQNDESFGKTRSAGLAIEVYGDPYPEGSLGFLSFNPVEADDANSPYSTNNLDQTVANPGSGRSVPRSTAHLVARGTCGDMTSTVEVLYFRPPYPTAVAASGPINATGGLQVAGLAPGAAYPGSPAAIPPEDRRPGSMQSNDPSTGTPHPAIRVGPNCKVMGDVAAPGSIDLDSSVVVGGEVHPGGDPQPMPSVDVRGLIAQARTASGGVVANSGSSLTVDWFSGRTGDLDISGDLVLDNGLLWVEGDLTVGQAVRGKGVVLVDGQVTIQGGASLNSENLLALAATGNETLEGDGPASYFFQGLVYSAGNVVAKDITVLGALLANGPSGCGNMTLENLNIVASNRVFEEGFPVALPPATAASGGRGTTWCWIRPRRGPTGTLRYDLRVHAVWSDGTTPNPRNYFWPDLDYAGVRAKAQWLYDTNGACPANEGTKNMINARLDAVTAAFPNSPGVIANNLLSPADRARVLLWKAIP